MPTTLGNFGLLSAKANDSALLVDKVRPSPPWPFTSLILVSDLLQQLLDSGLVIVGKTNLNVSTVPMPGNTI